MKRMIALYIQVKIVYYLTVNHGNYEKTVKDIYNELETWL